MKWIARIVLLCLLSVIGYSETVWASACDVDNDLDIDRNDIGQIFSARNTPATGIGDPRDADGDGIITVNDGRQCVLRCTLPRCAIVDSNNVDNDLDGFTENQGDCDDTDPNINPSAVDVPANGIDENCDGTDATLSAPDIEVLPGSLEFASVEELVTVEKTVTITNVGSALLEISSVSLDSTVFQVLNTPGDSFPLTIPTGESRNLLVQFTAPLISEGNQFAATLSIESNDPDEAIVSVSLLADTVEAVLPLQNNPIVDVAVTQIANCENVQGEVSFSENSSGADSFQVTLSDQGGVSVNSDVYSASEGAGVVPFVDINVCDLADGLHELEVALNQDGDTLPPVTANPTIKNTSDLLAPILDPLPAVTTLNVIEVCGSSQANTTVRIQGGASDMSTNLDVSTTRFCLQVPLRENTENTLIASAIDNVAQAPKPVAYATPVSVVQIDPSKIVIAEVYARLLSEAEIATLVENGVIDLDDPSNFTVSMFTVVLTVGSFPVTISQPVAIHKETSGVSYGGGSPVWQPGQAAGSPSGPGSSPRPPSGGCISGCAQIVVIQTETGQTIPGVIIIDGRIKTLKEFFQVTLVLFNNSESFVLRDMQADINLPAGLTPVRAGIGSDVSTVNQESEVDRIVITEIPPGESKSGQFIIRGDGVGTHTVRVDFQGFITEGGLPEAIPVNGSASTTLQVLGPPKLRVVVRHPSDPLGPDVLQNEIYDLIVEITNESSRPALYTSLELFVGGGAQLIDENGNTIPDSNELRTIGTIPPGRTARLAYRVKSLLQGEIIACQAIAAENIMLSVDTGASGASCLVNNMYPADFIPLLVDMSPSIIGINPLNGQVNIPVTASVIAVLTPQSACLTADTWTNITTSPIGGDTSKGLEVTSASLASVGTFYLEELDAFGEPVRHIPMDLVVENPVAGGTTIVTLRLGLADPLSQVFLKPNIYYRASLIGGTGGICSASSGAEMPETYRWVFSTKQDCSVTDDFTLLSTSPIDASADRPFNQSIALNFNNRIDASSIQFLPGNLPASTFGVYENALASADELISEGRVVVGKGLLSNLNSSIIYTPSANLQEDSQVHIRLTPGLRDVCGNALQTPANGVQLISFHTAAPDTTPPDVPVVNPIPPLINQDRVQVSGQAEPLSRIVITGGAEPKEANTSENGLFSVLVRLNQNEVNVLEVQATDASGNSSLIVQTDVADDDLVVKHDNTPLEVLSITPIDGATKVLTDSVVSVTLNKPFEPETVNTLNFVIIHAAVTISGDFIFVGDSQVTFVPDAPLNLDASYQIKIRGNGIRDRAGNGLSSDYVAEFMTETGNTPPVADAGPDRPVTAGDVVKLDGIASSDLDNDPLSYRWSMLSKPEASIANLSDETAVDPEFAADLPGVYKIQLVVNDGKEDSAPSIITIAAQPGNNKPVADAGTDQVVAVGNTVTLDGSSSNDLDGDILTYDWKIILAPNGSTATLFDQATVSPSFIVDKAGEYVIQLVVNDSKIDSVSDQVTVTTSNTLPVASAGTDLTVAIGTTVTLDGSGSNDIDGDTLTYQWSLNSPLGSNAQLINPATAAPSFLVDVAGDYKTSLVVNDGVVDSAPDEVVISTENSKPVANAGTNQTVNIGDTVTLNGSDSSDADGDSLSYQWTLSSPQGSTAVLSNPIKEMPTFIPDLVGEYIVQLTVRDGSLDSDPESVTIIVATPPQPGLICGALVSGSISAANETDLYTFSGVAGSLVAITLVETGGFAGSPVPQARLISPNNTQVGSAFNANSQPRFTLPANGTYSVQVNANNLVSTGSYNLGIECIFPSGGVDGSLNFGDLHSGAIEVAGETDLYTFSGTTGEQVAITIAQTSGFSPSTVHMTLYAPNGDVVTGTGYYANSQPHFTLSEDGTYMIRVIAGSLLHTGTYNLGLERLVAPAAIEANLVPGDLVSGAIEVAGETDLYTFSGITGEQVAITIAQTSGFSPSTVHMTLYAPNGDVVTGTGYYANSQPHFTLAKDGTYVIRVIAGSLLHTGTYNLGLERLVAPAAIEANLVPGDLVSGAIEVAGETDLYTFSGTTGEQVAITIAQTSGFSPSTVHMTLYAPNGDVVTGTGYYANSQPHFTLSEDGTYVIRVIAGSLLHTGTYNLGLERLVAPAAIEANLVPGDLVSGAIEVAGETDLYTFSGTTGEQVAITIAQTGGFSPSTVHMTLYAPNGDVVTGTGYYANSQPHFTLAKDGTYVIRVIAGSLLHTGTYNLGLERLVAPAAIEANLVPGDLVSGAIEVAGETDLYTFSGTTGEQVAITIAQTGGFSPSTVHMTLYAPNGDVVTGTGYYANSQPHFTLSEDGTYVIRVIAGSLLHTGTYDLGLDLVP